MMLEALRSWMPTVRLTNERELAVHVIRTTALCVSIALAFDIANQLVFFESWSVALRSWAITLFIVIIITVPVSRAIGKAHLALYRASTLDPLTGLLNRGALLDGVDQGSNFIALIIVDIDRFKHVNDTHGHWVGDQVLKATGTMIIQYLGHLGRVGRLGGEEFALLASIENKTLLIQELEAFRKRVAETPILTSATPVSITVSAGIASHRSRETFEQLFARADRALYRAKAGGRNRIVCADDEDLDDRSLRSDAAYAAKRPRYLA